MTSWITSLFASSQTSLLVSSRRQESTGAHNVNNYGDEQDITQHRDRRKAHYETVEEKMEEPRPPYLHVSQNFRPACVENL